MIRYFLLIAITLSCALSPNGAKAQGDRLKPVNGKDKSDRYSPAKHFKKIESIKIAYIARRMDLTPEESQRFWPVYNQYQKEITDILIRKKENMQQANGDDEKRLNTDLDYENKLLAVRKCYKDKFLKVLPAEKITLLTRCEREFKDELIQQLKQRREKQK